MKRQPDEPPHLFRGHIIEQGVFRRMMAEECGVTHIRHLADIANRDLLQRFQVEKSQQGLPQRFTGADRTRVARRSQVRPMYFVTHIQSQIWLVI